MSPLFLALDIVHRDTAVDIARKLRPYVGGYKLGLAFFVANGHVGVQAIAKLGLPIFLDLKLHDIPNTVSMAVQALRPLEPTIMTVHAAGGRAMMEEAKAAAGSKCKIIAVTVLTSLDTTDMAECGIARSTTDQVGWLADLARDSGLDGIVCSGQEVKAVHSLWPQGFFIVPGVRLPENAAGDQKRVVTPRQAMDDGASVLVVGRSVSQAAHPEDVLRTIKASL